MQGSIVLSVVVAYEAVRRIGVAQAERGRAPGRRRGAPAMTVTAAPLESPLDERRPQRGRPSSAADAACSAPLGLLRPAVGRCGSVSGADDVTSSGTVRRGAAPRRADRAGRARRPVGRAGRHRQHRPRGDAHPRHLVRRLGRLLLRPVGRRRWRPSPPAPSAACCTRSRPSPSASTTSCPASPSTCSAPASPATCRRSPTAATTRRRAPAQTQSPTIEAAARRQPAGAVERTRPARRPRATSAGSCCPTSPGSCAGSPPTSRSHAARRAARAAVASSCCGARPSACACARSARTPSPPTRSASRVYRMKYAAVVVSGALAGLGGAALVIGSIYREGQTAGRGFIGLAAVIFGNWRPGGLAAGAGLFGYADACSCAPAAPCARCCCSSRCCSSSSRSRQALRRRIPLVRRRAAHRRWRSSSGTPPSTPCRRSWSASRRTSSRCSCWPSPRSGCDHRPPTGMPYRRGQQT